MSIQDKDEKFFEEDAALPEDKECPFKKCTLYKHRKFLVKFLIAVVIFLKLRCLNKKAKEQSEKIDTINNKFDEMMQFLIDALCGTEEDSKDK